MSRPWFCPACGAALIGENAAVGLLDERSGDVGYDCSCRTCGWSGDVYPDDEQGEEASAQEHGKAHEAVLDGTRLTPAEALERARRTGRKPRGTPRGSRPRLEPGDTLAEAVIEDRR